MVSVLEQHIDMVGDDNVTYVGRVVVESAARPPPPPPPTTSSAPVGNEEDPVGAAAYVVAVILIYGMSIIFLIASHVVCKNRELHRDNEKQINKYLQAVSLIREKGAKDSYKSLKRSMIPAVAMSPARYLVSRRKSFAPFIQGLFNPSRRGSLAPSFKDSIIEEGNLSSLESSWEEEGEACRMSVIDEESVERSITNSNLLPRRRDPTPSDQDDTPSININQDRPPACPVNPARLAAVHTSSPATVRPLTDHQPPTIRPPPDQPARRPSYTPHTDPRRTSTTSSDLRVTFNMVHVSNVPTSGTALKSILTTDRRENFVHITCL